MIEPDASQREDSLARIRTLSEGIKIPSATVTPRDCFVFPVGGYIELPTGKQYDNHEHNDASQRD